MNVVDIILIIAICCVFYILYNNIGINSNSGERNKEKFDGKTADDVYTIDDTVNDKNIDYLNDDLNVDFNVNKYRIHNQKRLNKQKSDELKLKPNFMEVQFHNDYRDVITAFNDIAPDQKQIFNIQDAPTRLTNPPHKEVEKIVRDFIDLVNRDVQYNVSDYRGSNTGWDEKMPNLKNKFGWEEYMEKLGLPASLYADPAKRAPIELIKIDYVEKYVTEYETEYIITLIVQKVNVDDQMILKISFVRENYDVDTERQFFKDLDIDYTTNAKANNAKVDKNNKNQMVIEEIFIVGFLTNEGISDDANNPTNFDKLDFYDFKGLEGTDMVDQQTILKELIEKKKQRNKEMMAFTASLDDYDREFHAELPKQSDYLSYKCTRNVIDELTNKPITYE